MAIAIQQDPLLRDMENFRAQRNQHQQEETNDPLLSDMMAFRAKRQADLAISTADPNGDRARGLEPVADVVARTVRETGQTPRNNKLDNSSSTMAGVRGSAAALTNSIPVVGRINRRFNPSPVDVAPAPTAFGTTASQILSGLTRTMPEIIGGAVAGNIAGAAGAAAAGQADDLAYDEMIRRERAGDKGGYLGDLGTGSGLFRREMNGQPDPNDTGLRRAARALSIPLAGAGAAIGMKVGGGSATARAAQILAGAEPVKAIAKEVAKNLGFDVPDAILETAVNLYGQGMDLNDPGAARQVAVSAAVGSVASLAGTSIGARGKVARSDAQSEPAPAKTMAVLRPEYRMSDLNKAPQFDETFNLADIARSRAENANLVVDESATQPETIPVAPLKHAPEGVERPAQLEPAGFIDPGVAKTPNEQSSVSDSSQKPGMINIRLSADPNSQLVQIKAAPVVINSPHAEVGDVNFHLGHDGRRGWKVIEPVSGLAVGIGRTKEAAVAQATERLGKRKNVDYMLGKLREFEDKPANGLPAEKAEAETPAVNYKPDDAGDVARAILGGERVRTEDAYRYPGTKALFDKRYREVRVPVNTQRYVETGGKPGWLFADYIRLQGKHPEQFATPLDAKNHVEFVMGDPDASLPATKPGAIIFMRRSDGEHVAIVEFNQQPKSKDRVISAYTMDKGQWELKLSEEANRGGVPEPIPASKTPGGEQLLQGGGAPSDALRPDQPEIIIGKTGKKINRNAVNGEGGTGKTGEAVLPEGPQPLTSETLRLSVPPENIIGKIGNDVNSSPEFISMLSPEKQTRIAELKAKKYGHDSLGSTGGEWLSDKIEIGALYVEAGLRNFSEWSRRMIDDFGEDIIPHLSGIWSKVRETGGSIGEAANIATRSAGGDPAVSGGAGEMLTSLIEMNRRAQAEPEGQQTIGRPELANPAESRDSRRLVDAVDEWRKQNETPEQRNDAQVTAEADAMLKDYDGAKKTLLERGARGGMLNDVETAVAQKIVRQETFKAFASGDDQALLDAARLVDSYRETGTEQARAMRQRRDVFKTPAERNATFVAEALLTPDTATRSRMDGATEKADSAETAAKARDAELQKWISESKKLREKLEALGVDVNNLEKSMKDPTLAARAIREIRTAKAGAMDKLYEYWINAILSNPRTQIVNITGNALHGAWELGPQRFVEASINVVLKVPNAAQFGELKHVWAGMLPGMQRGFRNAMLAFKTGSAVLEDEIFGPGRGVNRTEYQPAIKGNVGQVVRIPTRLLIVADEFGKSLVAQMQVGAEAYRMAKEEGLKENALESRIQELMSNMQGEAWRRAGDEARRIVFQEKLGPAGQLLGKTPGLRWIVPFRTTIGNILKIMLRKSPLGSATMFARLANQGLIEMGVNKSGAWQYSKKLFVRDMAEQVIAWGLGAWMYSLVGERDEKGQPRITGSIPSGPGNRTLRDTAYRTAPPMSIRIGDRYYDYSRIDPLAGTLAATVDLAQGLRDVLDGGRPAGAAMSNYMAKMMGQIHQKSFMSGLSDLLDAVENEHQLGRWLANFGASFVPNIIRQAGVASDPMVRESRVWGKDAEWWGTLLRRTKERAFPYGSPGENKITPWGEKIEKAGFGAGPATDFVYRMLSPVNISDATKRDPLALKLDLMIAAWNRNHWEDQWMPGSPDPELGVSAVTRINPKAKSITPEDYQNFQIASGQRALKIVEAIEGKRAFNYENPTIGDMKLLKRVVEMSREQARKYMFSNIETTTRIEELMKDPNLARLLLEAKVKPPEPVSRNPFIGTTVFTRKESAK